MTHVRPARLLVRIPKEKERDAPGRQHFGNRVDHRSSKVDVQNSCIQGKRAGSLKSGGNPIVRTHNDTLAVGEYILDQQRHKHLILDNEDAHTGQIADASHYLSSEDEGSAGLPTRRGARRVAFTPLWVEIDRDLGGHVLLEATLDQHHAEIPCEWVAHRWSIRLAPLQNQDFIVRGLLQMPSDLDHTLRHRQCAMLHGVRRQFVDRHSQSQCGSRLQQNIWPFQDEIRATGRQERL